MKAVKVRVSEGEAVRHDLLERGLMARGYRIKRIGDYLLIPVLKDVEGHVMAEGEFDTFAPVPSFDKRAESLLGKELSKNMRTFDSIGDIAIMEITEPLEPYAEEIASLLLECSPHYKTVLAKAGALEGDFRTRQYVHLAGEMRTTTVHKEYGLRFEMDLSKVFFSPRLATERNRISGIAGEDETIIDMFCGVGPFSISIAKRHPGTDIYAIDLNPDAIGYLKKNIALNGTENITPICGDAKKTIPTLPRPDRILMNLPKFAHMFLSDAISHVGNGGVVHYYTIVDDGEEESHLTYIDTQSGKKESVVENMQRIKPYSPYSYMTCYDIRVSG